MTAPDFSTWSRENLERFAQQSFTEITELKKEWETPPQLAEAKIPQIFPNESENRDLDPHPQTDASP